MKRDRVSRSSDSVQGGGSLGKAGESPSSFCREVAGLSTQDVSLFTVNGWVITIVGGLIVGLLVLGVQRWIERRDRNRLLSPAASPEPVLPPRDPGPQLPEVTDEELWIFREMEKYGGARRQMHSQRASSGHSGTINSFWFGTAPVDYDQSRWIYDLMDGNSATLRHRGLIRSVGSDYFLTDLGQRMVSATRKRQIGDLPPIIDALTRQPRL